MEDNNNAVSDQMADAVSMLSGQPLGEVPQEDGQDAPPVQPADTNPAPAENEAEHSEKSRLGRKVVRLERIIEDKFKGIEELLKDLKTRPIQETEEPDPELSEVPTPEEVKAFVAKREEKLLKRLERKESDSAKDNGDKLVQYRNEYTRLVDDNLDPDEEPELYKLMTDTKDLKYCTKLTDDPKMDFATNLRLATRAVIQSAKKPKPNVHGKPSKVPTGVNVPGMETPKKGFDRAQLSPEEAQVAKLFSEEELAEMFAK